MKRRDVMGLLAVAGALVTLPGPAEAPRGHTVGALLETGEELHRSLWQVFTLSDSKPAVYPAVREQLDVLTQGLAEARTAADRARLCTMTADLYQLAGELFFDANRYTDAAQYYTLAAHAAHAGGDHDLWACAMTRHAYVELYARRAPTARSLLAVASRIARQGDSALSTRHWVAAVQAQVCAAMGDIDGCARALDEAEQVHSLDGHSPQRRLAPLRRFAPPRGTRGLLPPARSSRSRGGCPHRGPRPTAVPAPSRRRTERPCRPRGPPG
ncbi:hypothetical protein ACIGJO_02430 [Streptomyces sp. NPDC079020]|uniref:hypothetical protein n=1 Tax=Streptomyces sp. NPDC079020 TaxID=3365722 RepID=UPI0037D3943C